MQLFFIGFVSSMALLAGFVFYGSYLAKVFALDPARTTPAVSLNDGHDYVPIRPIILLGQHFSAIAAVGPIAGPILAGHQYGLVFSLLWIIVGAVFIGAVHDFSALVASVRHRALSIAEIAGLYMSPMARKIFLIYIWVTLLYVIVVFTDLTAAAFVSQPHLGGHNFGPGVATSSIFYLALALAVGFAMRRSKIPLSLITVLGVIMLLVFIKLGQYWPIDWPRQTWQAVILFYCFIASVIPLGTLLQPRGYLGGFLLYASLIAGLIGFIFYRTPTALTTGLAREHWFIWPPNAGLFPFLFTTIACGACSGFHGLVSSGTTSKQLAKETDARVVGYGGMLLEAFVAVVSLGALIVVSRQGVAASFSPDEIYARGLASFLTVAGIPFEFGVSFGKLAFATFIYDTLDVGTRLGRYIFQELTGWHRPWGRYVGSLATILLPAVVLLAGQQGHVAAWKAYWGIFGTANQLLACLTLASITVWLRKEGRNWLVTGLPCLFMATITLTSLIVINSRWMRSGLIFSSVNVAAGLLFLLAAIFLAQALRAFVYKRECVPSQ